MESYGPVFLIKEKILKGILDLGISKFLSKISYFFVKILGAKKFQIFSMSKMNHLQIKASDLAPI